jgi:antitoxin ParD1/3/4
MAQIDTYCHLLYCFVMALKVTKNISLTPHWEQFVEGKLRSGRYQSASEVVREGLRLLEEREVEFESTRRKISAGMQQSKRGEGRDGDTVMAEQRRRLVRKLAGRKNAAKRAHP